MPTAQATTSGRPHAPREPFATARVRLIERLHHVGFDELLVARAVAFAHRRRALVASDEDAERHRLLRIVEARDARVLVEDDGELHLVALHEGGHLGDRSGPSIATPTTMSPRGLFAAYIARRCGNSALQGSQNVDQKSSKMTSLPRWSARRNVLPSTSLAVKSERDLPPERSAAPFVPGGARRGRRACRRAAAGEADSAASGRADRRTRARSRAVFHGEAAQLHLAAIG